ncbi:MAG TPA: DUF502 domain-containing protein [Planctomycetaceae bacterium]|jgi:uncharacterized membrane protein|nr:DUF502 domain-containing protein [Planctomycetaceae bacterium]
MSNATPPVTPAKKRSSATYFFLRGLAIILPPILTVVILLWAANAFNTYIIQPVNSIVRFAVALARNDILPADSPNLKVPPAKFPELPDWHHEYRITSELADSAARGGVPTLEQLQTSQHAHKVYVPMGTGINAKQYVPLDDYDLVFKHLRPQPPPTTAIGLYMEIAADRSFRTAWQLSAVALSITIIALYFLGRFVSARIGAWFVHKFEYVLTQVPLVRNVYSTVKQVTDFVLSDREVEFKRVVALEYPRAGSWTVGFVTGEGMLECSAAVGEAMLTVLVPTSPMPAGGFTIMVPRSQVVDLDMTVDQALQFIVSCGVLTPPSQRTNPELLEVELRKRNEAPALIAEAGAPAAHESGNGL